MFRPLSEIANGVNKSYTTDDLDREAIRERNLRTLGRQAVEPREVAMLLGTPVKEVERGYRALGVELPCPNCGRPRAHGKVGYRATCGERACVNAAIGNAKRGRPGANKGMKHGPDCEHCERARRAHPPDCAHCVAARRPRPWQKGRPHTARSRARISRALRRRA